MIKTYHNDEELLKMPFNSFGMTYRVKISEKTCNYKTRRLSPKTITVNGKLQQMVVSALTANENIL